MQEISPALASPFRITFRCTLNERVRNWSVPLPQCGKPERVDLLRHLLRFGHQIRMFTHGDVAKFQRTLICRVKSARRESVLEGLNTDETSNIVICWALPQLVLMNQQDIFFRNDFEIAPGYMNVAVNAYCVAYYSLRIGYIVS